MWGRSLRRGCLLAVGGAVLATASAAAQPGQPPRVNGLPRLETDTLGLPPDAEPIEHRVLPGTDDCRIVGSVQLADTADLRRLRRYRRCAEMEFPSPEGRTLVGVLVMGDCHMTFRLDAFRSESRRELVLRVAKRYGGCRGGGFEYRWVELPPLPEGWRVRATEVDAGEVEPGLLVPQLLIEP